MQVKTMLCGDQEPVFTRDEVIKYTEPKLGYSKDSPGFLKFVNVLVSKLLKTLYLLCV